MLRIDKSLGHRAAAAFTEAEPTDLSPAQARALRHVSPGDYYRGLSALRREAWAEFLRIVPGSRRRTAFRALLDVVPARDQLRLTRLLAPRRRGPRKLQERRPKPQH